MLKPDPENNAVRTIVPARTIKGKVTGTLRADGRNFVSKAVDNLTLTYAGIDGDYHSGLTRRSGAREPWYERGVEMRNERQISILSEEELAVIADKLGIVRLQPGWLGANLVLEGLRDLSLIPPRTVLIFENGASLRVDGYNAPCRIAGGEIARQIGSRRTGGPLGEAPQQGKTDWTATDLAFAFVSAAHMRRGLVAWVEREGAIEPGENVQARIAEQWIY